MSTASTSHAHDHAHPHDHAHDHTHAHGKGGGYDLSQMKMTQCCSHHEEKSERAIVYALIGGALVLTTFIASRLNYDEELAQIPAVVGAIMLGIPLILASLRELRKGKVSSSSLAALAITAAFASTEFVTAGALAFILFIMDAIVRRTALGAHKAIEGLVALTPVVARRVATGGAEHEVAVTALQAGDIVRVRPGENLPADGVVVAGRSALNQASLTGESAPVEVQSDATVYAGTTNLTGQIDIRVTRVGGETTIGKVVGLIGEAENSRTPRQQIIEMVASHYVWIVLGVALAVWILSSTSTSGDSGGLNATQIAISVLVVTCPAALLLASPTAMVAAFAASARLGIMVKSTETLEAAAGIDSIVLDKTGTLTTGKFAVSRLAPVDGVDGASLLAAAVTAEKASNHPIAKAISETAAAARVNPESTEEAEELHGLGLKVRTLRGTTIYAGRAKWLLEVNPGAREAISTIEPRIEGMTAVHVMEDQRYLGAVGLEDRIRPRAAEVVTQLRELGVRRVSMFTGDREPVARRVGAAVGVDYIEAECHPQEKHDKLVAMTGRGERVMMVGDGINDGPSLAAADVGVAMGLSGTDIAANSAGIALMNDDLSRIPFLIQLARKTRAIIAQNIAASILIAIVGLALAASGNLGENPVIIAGLYHFLAEVFVIGNSFRLVRFGEDFDEIEHAARPGLAAAVPAGRPVAA